MILAGGQEWLEGFIKALQSLSDKYLQSRDDGLVVAVVYRLSQRTDYFPCVSFPSRCPMDDI